MKNSAIVSLILFVLLVLSFVFWQKGSPSSYLTGFSGGVFKGLLIPTVLGVIYLLFRSRKSA